MASWTLCLLAAAQLFAAEDRRIRLGIVPKAEEISLVAHGRITTADSKGRTVELPSGRRVKLEPGIKTLVMGKTVLPAETRLSPRSEGAHLEIDGKRYYGEFIARLDAGEESLTLIEEIGVEEYLLGVLPYEMDPSWPLEALKAQAVVARTFAYTQLGKYAKQGYDLSTDTRSQVYKGRSDDAVIRRAVDTTRGEVLGYKGQILNVYYHACCGGRTTSASAVWGGEAPPPLRGVADKYCQLSPHRKWTAFIAYEELLASLDRKRLLSGTLKKFEVAVYDRAGYAQSFRAKVGSERLDVRAPDFRAALGGALRSLRIRKLRRLKNGVEFEGGGLGHGVGLCQWGARLQAEKGRRYEKILQHYFPGATLSVIDE